MELLSSIGKVIEVEEGQIDIVTAISGSGPAFFYKVIEDMACAGENSDWIMKNHFFLLLKQLWGLLKWCLTEARLLFKI